MAAKMIVVSFLFVSMCAVTSYCKVYNSNSIEISRSEVKQQRPRSNNSGCSCNGNECGCCAHLDIPKIELNDTGCVNVTYLPSPDYGISVTFSLDGVIYYNYTVSARNPPPLCFGIPYLKKYASLCLRFYNISLTASSFYSCVRLEARLEGFKVDTIDFGCFKIPPNQGDKTLRYIPQKKFFMRSNLLLEHPLENYP